MDKEEMIAKLEKAAEEIAAVRQACIDQDLSWDVIDRVMSAYGSTAAAVLWLRRQQLNK